MKKVLLFCISLLSIVHLIKTDEDNEKDTEKDNEKDNEIYSVIEQIQSAQPFIQGIVDQTDKEYNISTTFKDACPNFSNDSSRAWELAKECRDKINPNLTVCTQWRTHFIQCVTPLANVLDKCAPTRNQGIFNWITRSADATVKYMCRLTGEQIFEFANSCYWPTKENKEDFKIFEKNVDIIPEKSISGCIDYLTVPNVCNFLDNLKKHLTIYMNKVCTNQVTKNTFFGLVDAWNTPCVGINKQ